MSAPAVIYLDQCHFSEMAKADPEGRAPHAILFRRLEELRVEGAVICPFSLYHVFETAALDAPSSRARIEAVIGLLSQGFCFRSFFDVAVEEVVQALGGANPRPLGRGVDCFPGSNKLGFLRAVTPQGPTAFRALVEMGQQAIIADARQFVSSSRQLLQGAQALDLGRSLDEIRTGDSDATPKSATLAELISEAARRSNRIPEDVELFLGADWRSKAPTLRHLCEIFARRRANHAQRVRTGDGMDLCHALALPYCKLALLERNAATLFRRSVQKQGTLVLARPDEMIEALSTLRGS